MDTEKAPERVKSFIARAKDAAKKKNYKYAIDMYVTALKHEPSLLEIRRDLRAIEMENISYKVSIFRQKKAQVTGMMSINKGRSAIKSGDYFDAMNYAETVLAADPTVGSALQLLADAAEAADMDLVAIDALEVYTRFNEKDLDAHHSLCELYSGNKMGQKAINLCRKLQAANPDNGKIEGWLKNYLANNAMDSGGIGDAEEVISSSSSDSDMKEAPSEAEPTDPIEALKAQVESSPEDMILRKKLGRLLHKSEMYDEAVEHLEKAVALGANDPNTVKLFNVSYVANLDSAIKAWQDYAEDNPSEASDAEESIASLVKQRQEFRLKSARERVAHYSNDPGAHFELGEVLYEMKEYDEAISELKEAELSARFQKQATLIKGKCYRLVKNYSSSIESFEEILSSFKEGTNEFLETRFELGQTYEEQGDLEQAKKYYGIVREHDPSYCGIQNKDL